MYRLFPWVCALVVVVAIAAFALLGSAEAETRLFTVRTDQPGVTIIEAVRNGQSLPVAGQNAGATFFRIDNPAGAVPCSNRIRFTASNGQSVDAPVDFCANNWQLTVAVGPAVSPGPAPVVVKPLPVAPLPAPAPAPAPRATLPVSGNQPVAITTDDPSVTITEVFLRGQPVPIAGRQDPYVQINVLGGPQGFECQRDLGLALSDGRRIARQVDICSANFLVVVALVGGPRPPPPPASFRPPAAIQPLPQPVPPLQPIEPAPPLPGSQPEIVSDMQWMFSATGARATFAYALPNSDSSEFTAACQARSTKVSITLGRTAAEVGPGLPVPVHLSAGAFARTYTAVGSAVSQLDGLSHPVLQIATSDPLWPALIKETVLVIAIGSEPPYGLSLSGSAVKAKQFLAVCNPAPTPPPVSVLPPPRPMLPPPAPGQGATAVGFVCNDGSFINVTFDNDTAVVYEPGSTPVVLFATPSPEGQRYVAGFSELVGEGERIFWTRDGGFARTCDPG